MGLTTFTAAVLLVAGAFQADAFTVNPAAAAGRNAVARTSSSQVSARGDVFQLNLSPYEEYMKSRGQTVDAPAQEESKPAAAAPSSSSSQPRRSSGGSKWEPRPDWKSSPNSRGGGGGSSRGGVSAPSSGGGVSAPSARSASPAPSPAPEPKQQQSGEKHRGVGGMADTRDPEPVNHADPRKSISAAPSFEEYLKSKKN